MNKNTKQYICTIDVESIGCVSDIIDELKKHEITLLGTDLEQLIYFSRTFSVTNKNIRLACEDGFFSKPALIEQLQIQFARLYFMTLNEYVVSRRLPREWKIVIEHSFIRLQPAELSLLLAIRAHIKCDSVQSLSRLSIDPQLIEEDFFRINQLLLSSSREIVRNYKPIDELFFLREIARKILIFPIYLMIARWRSNVWADFNSKY